LSKTGTQAGRPLLVSRDRLHAPASHIAAVTGITASDHAGHDATVGVDAIARPVSCSTRVTAIDSRGRRGGNGLGDLQAYAGPGSSRRKRRPAEAAPFLRKAPPPCCSGRQATARKSSDLWRRDVSNDPEARPNGRDSRDIHAQIIVSSARARHSTKRSGFAKPAYVQGLAREAFATSTLQQVHARRWRCGDARRSTRAFVPAVGFQPGGALTLES